MSLIDFPFNFSFGRDKTLASPVEPAISGQGLVAIDGRDVAILCLGIALVFTSIAVMALAAQR